MERKRTTNVNLQAEDSSILARYHMDENSGTIVWDSSGRGYDGKLTGTAKWTKGISNSGLELDGSINYISFNKWPTITGSGPFSIEVWIKTNGRNASIIQQRSRASCNGEYMLWIQKSGTIRWVIWGDKASGFDLSSDVRVDDNAWHHIVALRDANGFGELYIDGQFDYKGKSKENHLVDLQPIEVYIGVDGRDMNQHFKGIIDELTIYTRALSSDEIREKYNLLDPFVLCCKYGEESGTITVTDCSVNGNDGELHDPNGTAKVVSGPPGLEGAIELDGSNYISFGKGPSIIGLNPFRIQVWIKTSTTDGIASIVQQRSKTAYDGEYVLWIVEGKIRWAIWGGGATSFDLISKARVDDNEWHYIVLVRNPEDGRIFIDNALDSIVRINHKVYLKPIDVFVGIDGRDMNEPYKGKICGPTIETEALLPRR